MKKETNIQNASLLAVGSRPDVLPMRLQSGVFRSLHDDRVVRVGQKGVADSILIVAVEITADMIGSLVPVAVAAEFKTQKGKQSDDQKLWQSAFEKRGGIYRLIRSAGEIEALVAQVKSGKLFTKVNR